MSSSEGLSVGDSKSNSGRKSSGKGSLWLVLWSKDLFMRPMVVFPQGKGTERKDGSNRGGLSKARSSTALLRLLEGQGLMVKPD